MGTAAVLGRLALVAAGTAATVLAIAARGVPTAIGARAGTLRAANGASPHTASPLTGHGTFRNTEPGTGGSSAPTIIRALLSRGRTGTPARPVPLAPVEIAAKPAALAVTWFGHSSALIEIDGRRVLVDPMWGERASPSRRIGPRRMHPAPMPLTSLPAVDAILISHDHYDHLDLPTVRALIRSSEAPFVVPLGIGAHLRRWGLAANRIIELDWDAATEVAGLRLLCAEARHFSGRWLTRNTTLWSSWVIAGPVHRAYFGGDTGYTTAFARTGAEHGPFDLVLLPIGAYSHHWPDVHMTPEETVRAHRDLRGGMLLPVHWATFNLGFHEWDEPVERLRVAARDADVQLLVPRPGERADLTEPPAVRDWWTSVGHFPG